MVLDSETLALMVDPKELSKTLQTEAGENVIIDLNIRKGEESFQKVVMLKELQIHPLQRQTLHADFYEVSMDEMITVEVPVHLLGKSEGVKLGGILEQVLRTIQIQCLPGDIPRSIDVDVSPLMIGDSIHVKDLQLEKGQDSLRPQLHRCHRRSARCGRETGRRGCSGGRRRGRGKGGGRGKEEGGGKIVDREDHCGVGKPRSPLPMDPAQHWISGGGSTCRRESYLHLP